MSQPSKQSKAAYSASEKGKAQKKAHYLLNKEKYQHSERDRQYQKMYGISVDDYNRMLEEQGGVCKICGTDKPNTAGKKYFAIDHCHSTGVVRGLLCNVCNVAVGFVEKHYRRVAVYLEAPAEITREQ